MRMAITRFFINRPWEEDCNTRLPPRIESAATEWKTSVRISTFWLGSWWRNPCGKLFDSLIQVADLRTKFVHITAERAFQGRVSKMASRVKSETLRAPVAEQSFRSAQYSSSERRTLIILDRGLRTVIGNFSFQRRVSIKLLSPMDRELLMELTGVLCSGWKCWSAIRMGIQA